MSSGDDERDAMTLGLTLYQATNMKQSGVSETTQ